MGWREDQRWRELQAALQAFVSPGLTKGKGKGKGKDKGGKGKSDASKGKGGDVKVPCLDSRCNAWTLRSKARCDFCEAP